MSFDWRLYLDLATEMINDQKTPTLEEAYNRSAISRSYYGVYCTAASILRHRGIKIPKKDSHKFVIDEFRWSTDMVEQRIGISLDGLKKDRVTADYFSNKTIPKKQAQLSYLEAQQVFNQLDALANRSP